MKHKIIYVVPLTILIPILLCSCNISAQKTAGNIDYYKYETLNENKKQIFKNNPVEGSTNAAVSDDKNIVYITESGSKYHLPDCSYLNNTKIEITLENVKNERFQPCSKCNPPN